LFKIGFKLFKRKAQHLDFAKWKGSRWESLEGEMNGKLILRTKGITERESHIEQVQVKGILNAHI
jgi:hypothetical protein